MLDTKSQTINIYFLGCHQKEARALGLASLSPPAVQRQTKFAHHDLCHADDVGLYRLFRPVCVGESLPEDTNVEAHWHQLQVAGDAGCRV